MQEIPPFVLKIIQVEKPFSIVLYCKRIYKTQKEKAHPIRAGVRRAEPGKGVEKMESDIGRQKENTENILVHCRPPVVVIFIWSDGHGSSILAHATGPCPPIP